MKRTHHKLEEGTKWRKLFTLRISDLRVLYVYKNPGDNLRPVHTVRLLLRPFIATEGLHGIQW